jgi:hypothetical protein
MRKEKMMAHNNNNKSLFLYTALIFIVAILLILIAFFGDANLEKSMNSALQTAEPTVTQKADATIPERAAIISQENQKLMEENQKLKTESESAKKQLEIYASLTKALTEKEAGNVDGAKEIIAGLDAESLDELQKSLYNKIME